MGGGHGKVDPIEEFRAGREGKRKKLPRPQIPRNPDKPHKYPRVKTTEKAKTNWTQGEPNITKHKLN